MRASAVEFRFRMLIITVLIALGFWAPWIEPLGIGPRISTLEWLALELSRTGLVSFTAATPIVIVLGALIAFKAVVLRVWGTAYLGTVTVQHAQMQAATVMADGPYRYVRNPLYLGLWAMVVAMAFVMPPTGALFVVTVIPIFLLRLVFGEEAFLSAKLGQPYEAYLRTVPRLFPLLRSTVPHGGSKPRWLRAIIAEVNPIGVFITLAFLSWTYNNLLMVKAVLVTLGISLVVRAFLPQDHASSSAQP